MKRIVAFLHTEGGYDRQLLTGLAEGARLRPDWTIRTSPPNADALEVLRAWRPDMAVGRLGKAAVVRSLRRRRTPAVNTSNAMALPGVPRVGLDEHAIGRLAAEYLLGRGFEHFAYRRHPGLLLSRQREQAFAEALAEAGRTCLQPDSDPRAGGWQQFDPATMEWVRRAPKPLAIFACNDAVAQETTELCRAAGVGVPEEVAILGVDNDPLICELANPPLSSVAIPGRRVGQTAAQWLGRMLDGETIANHHTELLPPEGVVTRPSTDLLAIADEDLAGALRYIREHADRPLRVADVCEAAAVSRRALESKFRKHLGHSPLEEIQRAHLKRAEDLLRSTRLSIPDVARAAGLVSRERLTRLMSDRLGEPPAAYRRRHGAFG